MVFEFKLPDIGEGVHEGEIAKWHVQAGEPIAEDQPMVEVMTDKVTVEITSPVSGVVQSLNFKEGDVVQVGQSIISIDESNAPQAKAVSHSQAQQTTNGQQSAAAETAGASSRPTAPPPPQSVATMPRPQGEKVLAAPAVRKLARTMGIDLELVSGSGPRGRVRKDDIMSFAQTGGAPAQLPAAALVAQREERIPYRGMRRTIGEHLVKSKHTAPHFTYVEEADMTELVRLREQLAPAAEGQGIKLSYLPFIIKAVIEGLKQFPKLNSTLDEGRQEIVLKHFYNIGVAVATDNGLVVPVVKNAHAKTFLELAAEITRLSEKARQNKLDLTDVQGGTFTITSIGSIGGIMSAPIVNYPEVAIMGIQKIEKRPVVRNDEIVIRQMSYLSISCDHRVVDGAEAALFMREAIGWMENPQRFLLNLR